MSSTWPGCSLIILSIILFYLGPQPVSSLCASPSLLVFSETRCRCVLQCANDVELLACTHPHKGSRISRKFVADVLSMSKGKPTTRGSVLFPFLTLYVKRLGSSHRPRLLSFSPNINQCLDLNPCTEYGAPFLRHRLASPRPPRRHNNFLQS